MEKSIRQREGRGVQMAGPVGDASSSDQTAGGMEPVPENASEVIPSWRKHCVCSSQVDLKTA